MKLKADPQFYDDIKDCMQELGCSYKFDSLKALEWPRSAPLNN